MLKFIKLNKVDKQLDNLEEVYDSEISIRIFLF